MRNVRLGTPDKVNLPYKLRRTLEGPKVGLAERSFCPNMDLKLIVGRRECIVPRST